MISFCQVLGWELSAQLSRRLKSPRVPEVVSDIKVSFIILSSPIYISFGQILRGGMIDELLAD